MTSARFTDHVVLVTGGSDGMGLAAARRFLDEGAHVVVTGRDPARLARAEKTLDVPDRLLTVAGDVASPDDVDALVATVRRVHGRLDVVFANAGVAAFAPVTTVTDGELDRLLEINVKGVFRTVARTLPLLVDGGAIVVNASWTRLRGLAGGAAYSASKAGAHALVQALATELAPRGIRVNAVSPGYIETTMFHAEVADDAHPAIEASIPLHRLGTAEDVAGAVAFLASAEAGYVTGQDLVVDGGLVVAAGSLG